VLTDELVLDAGLASDMPAVLPPGHTMVNAPPEEAMYSKGAGRVMFGSLFFIIFVGRALRWFELPIFIWTVSPFHISNPGQVGKALSEAQAVFILLPREVMFPWLIFYGCSCHQKKRDKPFRSGKAK
jgi:hypothetical protein